MNRHYSLIVILFAALVSVQSAIAQDVLPADNGLATYHTAPRYRESESHPLRILAYVAHPIGWVAREVLFRPLSYFASSTETTRSVMGYREPFDYRQPECFSADDSIPDCRAISPFNYDSGAGNADTQETALNTGDHVREVYMPDVNFDFNVRTLNDLGKGQARRIKAMLDKEPNLKVVLEGHTDYKGGDTYNEKLGMDRSEAVRQELLALGVPAERLSTVTFGKTKPIFSDQTDWARAVNRRVQVHVDGEG
ncbi:MAG: OmpA family protein [Oligoflexia bacterium]|nr:OmpA family protein [Oligoflexia bacterium]